MAPQCLAAALSLLACTTTIAAVPDARHTLQRRQLEDSLRLNTQQGLIAPGALAPADRQRLEALQLRQRVEQQRLEQEQQRLQHERMRDPDALGLDTQQRLFDQQRQLQIQRFEQEQRELLRSAKPRPLQRPLPDGTLPP